MNILLTGNRKKKNFYKILNDVYIHITSKYNHDVFIDNYVKIDKVIKKYNFKNIDNKFNLIISIGGDGALLSSIRRMNEKQMPILGIHIGNLGFLNQCNQDNYLSELDYVCSIKKIKYQKYDILESSFDTIDNKNKTIYALNDFVVNQNKIVRMINLQVFVDDIFLNEYNCDGIIFSTPIGSTAYSLSAGGPIVSPLINGIIITPISPHSLSSRPIVIKSDSVLKIKFKKKQNSLCLSADGQTIDSLKNNKSIKIKKSKIFAKHVILKCENIYFNRLKNKLGW